jgi:ribonuclease-3
MVAAHTFLAPHFSAHLEALRQHGTPMDARSRLQELSQQHFAITPTYRTVATSGPEHDRTFDVEVLIGTRVCGRGSGRSQPEARMQAAIQALALLAQDATFDTHK